MRQIFATLFLISLLAGCAAPETEPVGLPVTEPTSTSTSIPATPEPSATVTPAFHPDAERGQILFSVYPYGDIGQINADGSGHFTLLDQPVNQGIYDNRFATWLPSGGGISYSVDNFAQAEIWLMTSDGSNPRMIVNDAATFSSHTWSPDGQSLAYVAQNRQIMIYNLADRSAIPLTDGGFLSEAEPDWSPNGVRIVFTAIREGNQDIFVINTDGTELIRVTDDPHNDQHPDWAPDNTTIAFSSTRDGDDIKDIFIINIDQGTEGEGNFPLQMTFSEMLEIDPDWSPDGSLIVYSTHEFGGEHATLFIMDAAGENHFQLTEKNIYFSPKWIP